MAAVSPRHGLRGRRPAAGGLLRQGPAQPPDARVGLGPLRPLLALPGARLLSPGGGETPDPINGWFTLLGPLFLLWVAWHEWRSYQWHEDPEALRWFAGASAISAATYFLVYETPVITKFIIHQTALQSAWLYNVVFFGSAPRATVIQDAAGESHIFLPGNDYAVTVVLACTAIQSIMIFVGAIWCLKAPSRRKWIAYAITAPVVYFLNLFRNAGIIYGYKDLGWGMFGIEPFEWMHSYVGKIGSLVALIVIALGVFATLPELHGNILDLFDLRKRNKPGFFKRPPKPPQAADLAPTVEA